MNSVDKFRVRIMSEIAEVSSFKKSWDAYASCLRNHTGNTPDEKKIFEIGEHLSEVFQNNSREGRDQANVSAGGAAWECLVTWYLNLIFWGTNVIATKKKSFIPETIVNACSVTIANNPTNTESDIVVFSIPNAERYDLLTIKEIDELISNDITAVNVAIVQQNNHENANPNVAGSYT